jgi:biotin transporter BioY
MKRGSTIFLKIAVFLIGTPVLALCIFGLPILAKEAAESNSEFTYVLYGILIVMYVSAIPFFIALYQAFKLLSYIDNNKAFSEISVKALKNIKFCAITISCLYVIGMPFFYIFAELDDAPGVILIGMVFIFAPMVIAVFAAVLQRLLQEAINIKSENDLTV